MTSGSRTDRGLTPRVAGLVLCGGLSRRMGADKARLELAGRTLLEHAVAIVERGLAIVQQGVAGLGSCEPGTWLASGAEARYAELGLPLAIDRAPHLGPLAGLEAGLRAVRAACEVESGAARVDEAGPMRICADVASITALRARVHTRSSDPLDVDTRADAAEARADAGDASRIPRADPEAWVLVLACDMPSVDPSVFERLLARAIALDLDVCLDESAHGLEPLCGVYSTRVLPAITAALDAGEAKATSYARFPLALPGDVRGRMPRVGSLGDRPSATRATALNLNTPEDLARERAARMERARPATRKETA